VCDGDTEVVSSSLAFGGVGVTSDEILVMIDDAARCFQQRTGVRPGKVLLADNLAAVLGYPGAVAGMLVTHSIHCEAVSVFPSYIPGDGDTDVVYRSFG